MISNLGKSTVDTWLKEGLKPSYEDIIYINALGLKVEKGQEMYQFGSVPRTAFLGELILSEPTVGKRIWMDKAQELIGKDYFTQLCFTAYSLYCPNDELPESTDVNEIVKQVANFKDNVLVKYTESQIFSIIDYVLNGNEHTDGESFKEEGEKERPFGYDIPKQTYSAARQLLNEALISNIPVEVKDEVTVTELERMVIVAALHEGTDILKNQLTNNAAKFYAASGRIHTRLVEERDKEQKNLSENKD